MNEGKIFPLIDTSKSFAGIRKSLSATLDWHQYWWVLLLYGIIPRSVMRVFLYEMF
jgi:hypothetical protein